MSDVDVTKLSDQELLALLNSDQPRAAPPVQPVDVSPLAAPPGLNSHGQPFDANAPAAQPPPVSGLHTASDSVNAFSSGVPIVGGLLKEADAATDAAIAPYVEPVLRKAPPLVQALLGYDPKADIGNLPTFRQRYDAGLNLQRFSADRFKSDHPIADAGLKVTGGVAGTLAALPVLGAGTAMAGPEAGLLARSMAGAAEGGGIGATDAYTRGNGALDDPSRIQGMQSGAVFGALGGAALPVASQVAKVGYKATAGRLVDALRGQRTVQAPLEEQAAAMAARLRAGANQAGTDTGDEAALISAQRAPLTVNASNLDDAYLRIARAIKRQEMTPQEAASAAERLGPLGVLADTGEGTRDLLRAAMNRPGAGGTIAADNLRPRQAGIFDPETGSWLARPSSIRIGDQAQAGLGLTGKDYYGELDNLIASRKAAAGPAYAKAEAAPAVDASALSDFSASPMFKGAYDRARAISQKEFIRLPDGTEVLQPLPETIPAKLDWRTLDLMKQAMDDTVSEGARQGIGANAQGASKGYIQRFVAKLDTLNPDYKPARDAFAGPSAMKDALEEGRGLLNEDAPTVVADLANRPESERQMLRLGALQALQTKLGNANVTFDAASQAGLMKPNQLAKFKALFPDQKSFADFYTTLKNEKDMFATNQAAFGNSSTAKQMLNVNEASDPVLEGVSRVVESAPSGNVMGLIRGIHQLGQESPLTEDTASAIASILSRHHGPEMKTVVQQIQEAQHRAMIADILRRSNGSATGMAASQTVQRDQ